MKKSGDNTTIPDVRGLGGKIQRYFEGKLIPGGKAKAIDWSKTPYQVRMGSPEEQASADAYMRMRQAALYGQLTNLGVLGLMLGGGLGMFRQAPKMVALTGLPKGRLKKDKKEKVEDGEAHVKESQLLDDIRMRMFNKGIVSPPADKPGFLEAWTDLLRRKMFPMPRSSADVPLVPGSGTMTGWPGSAYPAGVATLLGSALAADKLTDWITDKSRAKIMAKRKQKLRREFEELLADDSGAIKTAGVSAGPLVVGLGTIYALWSMMEAAKLGAGLRRRTDPGRIQQSALDHALKLRRTGLPTTIRLQPIEPEEAASEEEKERKAPILSRTPVEIPVVLPPRYRSKVKRDEAPSEYDEALDLLKFSNIDMEKSAQWWNPLAGTGKRLGDKMWNAGLGNAVGTWRDLQSFRKGRVPAGIQQSLGAMARRAADEAGIPGVQKQVADVQKQMAPLMDMGSKFQQAGANLKSWLQPFSEIGGEIKPYIAKLLNLLLGRYMQPQQGPGQAAQYGFGGYGPSETFRKYMMPHGGF